MDLNEYQKHAARTIRPGLVGTRLMTNAALGLTGESGEVAELIKKHLFHDHPLDTQKVMKELGDVLWYIAAMATAVGVTLDQVGQMNVDKLRLRYPDGFDSNKSINRKVNDV